MFDQRFNWKNTKSMKTFLVISLGAILGANCRYWLGGWAVQRFGVAFPYGNLIINLSGSFILFHPRTIFFRDFPQHTI